MIGDVVELDGNTVGVTVGIVEEGSIDGINEGTNNKEGIAVGEVTGGGKGIVKGPLKKLPGSYLAFTVISLAMFPPK